MKFKAASVPKKKKPFRLLICGSRSFADRELLFAKLDSLTQKLTGKRTVIVVHGGAQGADRLAGKWAFERGLVQEVHHPDWQKLGKKAGIVRNGTMIESADAVVAFWDESSPGTADTLTRARKAGLPLRVVTFVPIKEGKGKRR